MNFAKDFDVLFNRYWEATFLLLEEKILFYAILFKRYINFLRNARSVFNVNLLTCFFCSVFQQREEEVLLSTPLALNLFNSRGKNLFKHKSNKLKTIPKQC